MTTPSTDMYVSFPDAQIDLLFLTFFFLLIALIFPCWRSLCFMPALSLFFFLQNSHWALMINKTLPTMRETQSVLVLAESEKDKDNYSLNRQSPWWRPHNQDCMCILGSFHGNAGQAPPKNEEPSNKVDGCWPRQANTGAWVTGGVWTWSLEICMSN